MTSTTLSTLASLSEGLGVRDDTIAMQHFFPGWKFDNERPSFDR